MSTRLVLWAVLALAVPVHAAVFADDVLFNSIRSAARLPDAPVAESRFPGTVRVLDAADLERSGARTLAEALGRVPGVVSFDQVGNPFSPTIDMRGWNATPVPATIIVVDGVRVNENDFGQVNWQLIPIDSIERVEVLPGPATLYGKDALAGVIQVFTKRGNAKTEVSASAGAGSYGRVDLDAAARGLIAGYDYSVSAQRAQEDGYRRGAGSMVTQTQASVGRRTKTDDVRLTYAFADDRLIQGGALTEAEFAADPRQTVSFVKNDSLLHAATLNARHTFFEGFSGAVLGELRDRLENTPENHGRTSESTSRSAMLTSGGAGQLTLDQTAGGRRYVVSAGVEGSRADSESSAAGTFFGPFASANATRDTRLGTFLTSSVDLWPSGAVLTAGARWDRTSLDYKNRFNPTDDGVRTYQRATPRVGLNWTLPHGFDLRASYAEAFRSPTADEISSLGPVASTPDLRPIKARSWEFGARYKDPVWGGADVAVFRTMATDEIYYAVYDAVADLGQNTNIGRTRRQGVEVSLKPRLGPVDAWVDWSYTEATFQTTFTLDKPPYAPTYETINPGANIPMVPRQKVSIGATAPLGNGLRATAAGLCVGSSHLFGDEASQETKLPGYCTLDLDASWEVNSWTLSLSAKNALDEKYATRGILGSNTVTFLPERYVTPAQGRTLFARVRWRFKG
jgi:outer membrane receptor protein involved in Fe transport